MSTCCYGLIVQEPSTTNNSSSSRVPKTGAQLRDNPEEREKFGKTRPEPLHRRHHPAESKPRLAATGMSTDSGDELNLKHLHWRETRTTTCTTGTSSTLSMSANWRTSTVFCTLSNKHLTSQTTGTSTTFSNNYACGISKEMTPLPLCR